MAGASPPKRNHAICHSNQMAITIRKPKTDPSYTQSHSRCDQSAELDRFQPAVSLQASSSRTSAMAASAPAPCLRQAAHGLILVVGFRSFRRPLT